MHIDSLRENAAEVLGDQQYGVKTALRIVAEARSVDKSEFQPGNDSGVAFASIGTFRISAVHKNGKVNVAYQPAWCPLR
jgi:hypothetical protein